MSVVSRPRVLFLLGALAACGGGDDEPVGAVDGRTPDAALDAPTDATPTGMVPLGSRQVCPREVAVRGDQLYWLEYDVLVRSPIDAFSPEVVYTGVRGSGLDLADGAVYWLSDWPVRLDLETREARPVLARSVDGFEVLDNGRTIVIVDQNRVAEVDETGQLRDLYTAPSGSLTSLVSSGDWLMWSRAGSNGVSLEWLDAVGGRRESMQDAGNTRFAAGDGSFVMARWDETMSSTLRSVKSGEYRGEKTVPFHVERMAIAGDGSLYAVANHNQLLFRAPASSFAPVFEATDTTLEVYAVAALDGGGAIAVSCPSSGTAAFHRFYP